MNLILLFPSDFLIDTNRVRITDRRLKHILDILKPAPGDTLAVGLLDSGRSRSCGPRSPDEGRMGRGKVVALTAGMIELEIALDSAPPAKLPVVLCVALMRPIVLRRLLQTVTTMGVAEVHIFNSRRVEKSFWQSTALREEEIRGELVLGLEQAKDTVLPEVLFHKRFKPFVEDIVPELLGRCGRRGNAGGAGEETVGLVADPSGEPFYTVLSGGPAGPAPRRVLIVGPEGGFIPYEIEKFRQSGCRIVNLGERLLRVETAVVALLARLL